MVGNETDMTEHPDDILRALATPSVCGSPAPWRRATPRPAQLAETLELPLRGVRRRT